MRISVIGTGYVGLVVGTCLADMGNEVICVDNNKIKFDKLKKGIIPIYEPGLEELVKSNLAEKRLIFTDNLADAIQKTTVCFIAVGTPQDTDGYADLGDFFSVVESIAKSMNEYKVIVQKSTVPVGTAEKVSEIIKKHSSFNFDIVSNPEFLKQGNAVDDFLHPDRVIIGSESEKATNILKEVYAPFFRTANRVLVMDIKSAELTKYAANSFLATKISFMNEIANLCEKVGADVEKVRIAMSTDNRIGNKFLFPGIGYGGSCFPKDIKALIKSGAEYGCDMEIIKATDSVNEKQKKLFVNKIVEYFGADLSNITFGVWGLSFKPNTNDMREAPSVAIINELLSKGAKIKAYDPKAMELAKDYLGETVYYAKNSYDALNDTDCMLLFTEWNEFRRPDFNKIKSIMRKAVIFDGRNQYDTQTLKEYGFEYFSIGR